MTHGTAVLASVSLHQVPVSPVQGGTSNGLLLFSLVLIVTIAGGFIWLSNQSNSGGVTTRRTLSGEVVSRTEIPGGLVLVLHTASSFSSVHQDAMRYPMSLREVADGQVLDMTMACHPETSIALPLPADHIIEASYWGRPGDTIWIDVISVERRIVAWTVRDEAGAVARAAAPWVGGQTMLG